MQYISQAPRDQNPLRLLRECIGVGLIDRVASRLARGAEFVLDLAEEHLGFVMLLTTSKVGVSHCTPLRVMRGNFPRHSSNKSAWVPARTKLMVLPSTW